MRAVDITRPGGPEVLQLVEVTDPAPQRGEVLLEVAATAVNRADLMQRQGNYPPPKGESQYPGLECSGVIRALGDGVTGWTVGQQVCALLAGGGYASLVKVPAGQLMPVPAGISLVDAAALPEVMCTVWSMVFQRGRLRAGETLLVHGGSSGVGTAAIQLGKYFGARVITTAGTPRKVRYCLELGADIAVNYREQDFVDVVSAAGWADVILDNMGASYLVRNLRALARDGRLIVLGMQGGTEGELDLGLLLSKRATISSASLRAQPPAAKAAIVAATVDNIWPAIAVGAVRPIIDRVLTLDDAAEAHRLVESSDHIGKVVLRVR